MTNSLEQESSSGIKVEHINGVGIQGIMRETSKQKGIVIDLTGRCEWDGKDWDLSDKRKRAHVIDKVTRKQTLLVVTKDVNKKYREMTNQEFESKSKREKMKGERGNPSA